LVVKIFNAEVAKKTQIFFTLISASKKYRIVL